MANYEINLTATQIEAALNKAHAPATNVDDTQNLVESGAIKTYVDTKVSAGASITTESFAGSALEDSTDGLTATDTAIPTSNAVKDYVDTRFDASKLASGYTLLGYSSASGTTSSSGFIICQASNLVSDDDAVITVTVAGVEFKSSAQGRFDTANLTIPIASGESYTVTINGASGELIRFKAFT